MDSEDEPAEEKTEVKTEKDEKEGKEGTEDKDLDKAAFEARVYAELDGMGMLTFWRYCQGRHPEMTASEALNAIEKTEKQHGGKASRLAKMKGLLAVYEQISQTKKTKKRKLKVKEEEGDIEEALDAEVTKAVPKVRLRKKTTLPGQLSSCEL